MKKILLAVFCLVGLCIAEPIRKGGSDYSLFIEDGGRVTADNSGTPLELRDIKVTLKNLSQSPMRLSCVKSGVYQSSYLTGRNPRKLWYAVEKVDVDGHWIDARAGYSGWPSDEIFLEPNDTISFIAPLPYKRNIIPGKFRIKIQTIMGEREFRIDNLISNEIAVD